MHQRKSKNGLRISAILSDQTSPAVYILSWKNTTILTDNVRGSKRITLYSRDDNRRKTIIIQTRHGRYSKKLSVPSRLTVTVKDTRTKSVVASRPSQSNSTSTKKPGLELFYVKSKKDKPKVDIDRMKPSNGPNTSRTKEVCDSQHDGRLIMKENLSLHVDSVFNLLFTSNTGFLASFHEKRKSTDLSMGQWHSNRDGSQTRTVTVTVALQAGVGPKTVRVTEGQVLRKCSSPGELYSVDVVSVNEGVPYADVFNISTHYCLARANNNTTNMLVFAKVNFVKSTWAVIKTFIVKNSFEGLADYFQCLHKELQKEAGKKPVIKKPFF